MTIITADGRTIEFAGSLDGKNVTVDRRVTADRREFDHNVLDQRVGDRRQEQPVETPVKEERSSTAKDWRDDLQGRNIQAWMEDLLTRIELRVGIDHTIVHQDGRKEEIECIPPTV